jgi:hypothetical protein
MVVRGIEREDIEFISKTLGCLPIAHIDHMRPEKLGSAELVEEVDVSCFAQTVRGGEGVFWGHCGLMPLAHINCMQAYYHHSSWQRRAGGGD